MILHAPMEQQNTPDEDAVWVGQLDVETLAELAPRERLELADGSAYRSAKIMLRKGGAMLGFMITPVLDGALPGAFAAQARGKAAFASAPVTSDAALALSFTVAICTHERPDNLREALRSITQLDYPNFEILVVDNAPTTELTRDMLANEYPQVRYIREPHKGVSQARNAAIAAARGDYIAFTDDDVVVDPHWLQAYSRVFAGDEGICCVTGLVPSGELATATQRYFDGRVTWGDIAEPRVYRLGETYPDLPAFPFSVGAYGTGANFAICRNLGLSFDGVLGAGRPTGGGEDIDFFFRVLQAGKALAVAPDAIVWHRHRASEAALLSQTHTYGLGLGAWLTKLLLTPRVWPQIAVRGIAGLHRFKHLGGDNHVKDVNLLRVDTALDRRMRGIEKRAVLGGPGIYLVERLRRAG